MWKKIKNLINKIQMRYLILYFVLCFISILIEITNFNLGNIDIFYSEKFKGFVNLLRDTLTIITKFKILFIILYCIDIILIVFKFILKNDTIKILIINTFPNTTNKILTYYSNEEKYEYDLSSNMDTLNGNYVGYSKIIDDIDNITKNYMQGKSKSNNAFSGIIHTPFALRLGFKIGDETYFKLFHKKRGCEYFELLTDKEKYTGNYAKIIVQSKINDSEELIVSIATTFPITAEQLRRFDIEKNSYIKFETQEFGFDVISSEKQINEYKKIILENVRDIVREKKIKIIHLCILSSVAFTFAFGQGLSKSYDPEIIIYNYDKQNYTWGVKVFANSNESIVNDQKIINREI